MHFDRDCQLPRDVRMKTANTDTRVSTGGRHTPGWRTMARHLGLDRLSKAARPMLFRACMTLYQAGVRRNASGEASTSAAR